MSAPLNHAGAGLLPAVPCGAEAGIARPGAITCPRCVKLVRATSAARARLEELRAELRSESISYGELAELQSLAPFIDASDVELLEAAGVPEFADDEGVTR